MNTIIDNICYLNYWACCMGYVWQHIWKRLKWYQTSSFKNTFDLSVFFIFQKEAHINLQTKQLTNIDKHHRASAKRCGAILAVLWALSLDQRQAFGCVEKISARYWLIISSVSENNMNPYVFTGFIKIWKRWKTHIIEKRILAKANTL